MALLGGSAGGTLVYNALAPPQGVGGAIPADAIASWSGSLEFDRHDQGTAWPCYEHHSSDTEKCAQNTNQYLDCGPVYPNSACGSPPQYGRYIEAGPITSYSDKETLPVSFFANGGGPYQGPDGQDLPEPISLQSMVDFTNWLDTVNGWDINVDYLDCIVDEPKHGSALRTWPCNDDPTKTVWYRTVEFWGSAVGP